MKVLVVDDSMVARKIVSKHLKSTSSYLHAEIIEAPSGEEGLKLFDSSIEVVISDWNMPGISGLEFVKKLRELENTWERQDSEKIPVVMVTTEATIDKVLEALDSGVNEYVIKPFAAGTLIDAINRVTVGRAD
jgi:two-component system, chemotaxis family, chemotaxis protein CheY